MKHLSNLYWKISTAFFLIILALGGLYIFFATRTAFSFFEETNERLNMSVAKQIAGDIEPFSNDDINKTSTEQRFKNVMGLNPAAEIYLLNKTGKILAYSAPDSVVRRSSISLDPIKKFIATNGTVFVEGDNPRDPATLKAFSAAAIENHGIIEGYVYIILGGDKYQSVTRSFMSSYKLRIGLASIGFTILAALLIGLVAFLVITRDINKMINHVKDFQNGAWHKRIILNSGGDLGLLASTFNSMAEKIEMNIRNIEAMEQSRRELVANISHDLRTPLAVIQGYAETLLLKKDMLNDADRASYTRIVLKNATRLKKLVDELFELSKLEAKTVVPAFEPLSIAELLLDNVLKYRIIAEQKKITIHTNIPKDIGFVFADIGLIDRVLQNLIDNAVKFTPENGNIITGLKEMDGHIEISIADSGIGIPTERLPHIFERYIHFDTKGTDKSGLGLGLAIIRKILELHNTVLQVKSKVEEGSIFSFLLPQAKSESIGRSIN